MRFQSFAGALRTCLDAFAGVSNGVRFRLRTNRCDVASAFVPWPDRGVVGTNWIQAGPALLTAALFLPRSR